MSKMGMDVDKVETLGKKLQTKASDIQTLISDVNGIIGQLQDHWWGPDAKDFVDNKWPTQRKTLHTAQQHLDHLGSSAIKEATAQRHTSA